MLCGGKKGSEQWGGSDTLQDGHRSHWEDAYEKQSPKKVEN